MKKVVIGTILVLVVAVGIGVFYVLSNLDALVKNAIETAGSETTRTAVRVESVNIKLRDAAAAVHGMSVANPTGFKTKQAFSLGEISTRLDLEGSSKELVIIDHITVRKPQVFFELNEAGKSNLNQLRKTISAGSGADTAQKESGQAGDAGPKLIIRKILFEDGRIDALVTPLNKEYELNLPKIEMQDLGAPGGASPERIANQVLGKLTDQAIAQVRKKGIDQYKEKLEGEVKQKLQEEEQKVREKIGGEATDALKGLLEQKK